MNIDITLNVIITLLNVYNIYIITDQDLFLISLGFDVTRVFQCRLIGISIRLNLDGCDDGILHPKKPIQHVIGVFPSGVYILFPV